MKASSSSVSKLLDFPSVYEDATLSEVDPSQAINIMRDVKVAISDYIDELAAQAGKNYTFNLRFPCISLGSAKDDEVIHLPFMDCSLWLWETMKKQSDNIVFKVVSYFYVNVLFIRVKLDMYGYSNELPITADVLDEYHIVDLFGVYAYEMVFIDALKYIQG